MFEHLRLDSADSGSTPDFPTAENCSSDPNESLRKLFVDVFQGSGLEAGRDPATRPVFLRLHGAIHGYLEVVPELPDEFKVGIFKQKPKYPVWVRSSSDIQPGRPDFKGTVGIALKLFDVEGEKLLAPNQEATTQDFILQNHDVFFVDTARDMCEFTRLALRACLLIQEFVGSSRLSIR